MAETKQPSLFKEADLALSYRPATHALDLWIVVAWYPRDMRWKVFKPTFIAEKAAESYAQDLSSSYGRRLVFHLGQPLDPAVKK